MNRRLHELAFANDAASAVSVIYVPCYLTGDDGIFNMAYYDLLPGLDATVFASYYEPWGYTPLESVAFGVPTVTTTLAGFGMWVLENCSAGFADSGVDVVERTDGNYADAVARIASDIRSLCAADAPAMAGIRDAARHGRPCALDRVHALLRQRLLRRPHRATSVSKNKNITLTRIRQ